MRVILSFIMLGLCVLLPVREAIAYPAVQEVDAGEVDAWLLRSDHVPVFTLRLTFKGGGSIYDPLGKEGLAQLTSAMLTEGAGDMNAEAFHAALDEKAISLAVSAGDEELNITMRSIVSHYERAFELLQMMLTAPQLPELAIAQNKDRMASARRRNEQYPSMQARNRLRELLFGNHPYGRDPLGTDISVDSITQDDIRQYLVERVQADALIVSVAGQINRSMVEDKVGDLVDEISAVSSKPKTWSKAVIQTGVTDYVKTEEGQSHIAFALPGIKRTDSDFYAAYILNHLLGGGGFTSRLMKVLREEKSLVYSVSTGMDVAEGAPMLAGVVSTRPGQEALVINELRAVMQSLHDGEIAEQDVKEAIDYVTGSFPLNLDTTSEMSAYLISMQRYDLGKDYLAKRNDYFKAVTLEDVKRVAERLLKTELLSYVVAGQEEVKAVPVAAATNKKEKQAEDTMNEAGKVSQ